MSRLPEGHSVAGSNPASRETLSSSDGRAYEIPAQTFYLNKKKEVYTMNVYASQFNKFKTTPQSEPIPTRTDQVKNNAGGYVFEADKMMQLKRFLCLGTVGGTYYVGEESLTKENFATIMESMNSLETAETALDVAAEYSFTGRIAKNDTAIVVLVCAFNSRIKEVRKLAKEYFSKIIRIPTHMFIFVDYIKRTRGFGRLIKDAIAEWYNEKTYDNLVYHCLKYQKRNNWSHIDVLRLTHVVPKDEQFDRFFGWLAGKKEPVANKMLEGFFKLREPNLSEKEVVKIIQDYNITWEFVPSQYLGLKKVWIALLPNLPFTALIRNLARMTGLGILTEFSEETKYVVTKITEKELIKKSRIHPLQIANALVTYSQGSGYRGSMIWTPTNVIIQALDVALGMSFDNVPTTNKNFYVALDVSGSMTWGNISGSVLNYMQGAALMALATVKAENYCHTAAFSGTMQKLNILKTDNLTNVYRKIIGLRFDATDCALPMLDALDKNLPIDIFCIYTDNQTWFGDIHPCQALDKYRQKTGRNAKLAVISMAATRFSIADPNDPYQLDFVGFDSVTPQAISEFALL